MDTFRSSRNAVLELSAKYKDLIQDLRAKKDTTYDAEAEKLIFVEMMEICLWGNATDLSLLTSLTYEDIQKLQGSKARKAAEKNVLVNDLPQTYDLLSKAREEGKKERRIDIVLDNAGFELYVDLILAGYLLASDLATQIVIRPKSIPWFVSDVLPSDFSALLNAVSNPKPFFETQSEDEELQGKTPEPLSDKDTEDLKFMFQDWTNLYAEGGLIMRPNRYWTAGGSYWRLPHEAPELVEDLKQADLVLFKGDLNYRKLVGDVSGHHVLLQGTICILPINWLTLQRLPGILLPPSRRQSAPTAQVRVSTSCLCVHARPTSSSTCHRAKTRSSRLWKEVAAIVVRGSGLGTGNGPLCACPSDLDGDCNFTRICLPLAYLLDPRYCFALFRARDRLDPGRLY
jgi:uncharacterized protein with ATP-grasp and redox domains